MNDSQPSVLRRIPWRSIAIVFPFLAVFIALSIIGMLPVAGCLTLILWPFVGIGWLIVTIMGIVKATNGERFVIPGLSDLVAKF